MRVEMAVPTQQEMLNLLERLRTAQRELIFSAAKATVAPSENTVRRVADLEIGPTPPPPRSTHSVVAALLMLR
jgi:hypothetical protein